MLRRFKIEKSSLKTFFLINMLEPAEVSRDFERLLAYNLKEKLIGTLPYDMNVKAAVGNCQPVAYYNNRAPFVVFLDRAITNLFEKI
jgi:hypothetical protein